MWRYFLSSLHRATASIVFPMHVGVFPTTSWRIWRSKCLPHARGGVSGDNPFFWRTGASSPRMWGCFRHCNAVAAFRHVFPMHVGVFPYPAGFDKSVGGFPHVGGGCFQVELGYTSRCKVFPTRVGVFLRCAQTSI